nr:uncharacterized protein LOC128698440 [Cherax quadricarinatus]
MEVEAAKIIWPRSVEYDMQFEVIVSDSDDTETLAGLRSMNNGEGPYPDMLVRKEECIDYYSKRLKIRLQQLAKNIYSEKLRESGESRKQSSLRGKDLLTDVTIEKLASYFSHDIRQNINTNEEKMKNVILSSLYHCCSTDNRPQHHLCPKGANSWCFYQRANATNTKPPSHNTMKARLRLEPENEAAVKQIYHELTSKDKMQRCLKVRGQNPNESLHQRISSYCPKTKYKFKRDLDFAAAHAISEYNSGYENTCLDTSFGLKRSRVTQQKLRKLDELMQKNSGRRDK